MDSGHFEIIANLVDSEEDLETLKIDNQKTVCFNPKTQELFGDVKLKESLTTHFHNRLLAYHWFPPKTPETLNPQKKEEKETRKHKKLPVSSSHRRSGYINRVSELETNLSGDKIQTAGACAQTAAVLTRAFSITRCYIAY